MSFMKRERERSGVHFLTTLCYFMFAVKKYCYFAWSLLYKWDKVKIQNSQSPDPISHGR